MPDKDEIRCVNCNKKLAIEVKGTLKIACPRCKVVNIFVIVDKKENRV